MVGCYHLMVFWGASNQSVSCALIESKVFVVLWALPKFECGVYPRALREILSVPQNNVMNLNNVMFRLPNIVLIVGSGWIVFHWISNCDMHIVISSFVTKYGCNSYGRSKWIFYFFSHVDLLIVLVMETQNRLINSKHVIVQCHGKIILLFLMFST
jgi:hypothetical protein